MIKIIHKYIFYTILKPFLLANLIMVITMLGLVFYQFSDILFNYFTLLDSIKLLIYSLPEILNETLSLSIIFGILIGFKKLKNNNEILIFKLNSISKFKMILPVIILALLITSFNYLLSENLIPNSREKINSLIKTHSQSNLPNMESNLIFRDLQNRAFYIKEYDSDNEIIKNITIYDYNDNEFPKIFSAKKAKIINGNWFLINGTIHSYNLEGQIEIDLNFDELKINLDNIERYIYNSTEITEMTRKELKDEIDIFKNSGLSYKEYEIEFHFRLANSFIPLIFTLISIPFALKLKLNKGKEIIISVSIIFIYYVLISIAKVLALNNIITPLFSAWIINLFFMSFVFLYFLKSKLKLKNIFILILILIFNFNSYILASDISNPIYIYSENVIVNDKEFLLENIQLNFDDNFIKADQGKLNFNSNEFKFNKFKFKNNDLEIISQKLFFNYKYNSLNSNETTNLIYQNNSIITQKIEINLEPLYFGSKNIKGIIKF